MAIAKSLWSLARVSTVARNSGWLLFDKLVRILLGITVGAWVARYLGPEGYGELFYALTFVALFQPIAALGMDGVVVRDIAKDRHCAPSVLGSAFRIRIAMGAVAWGLAAVGILLVRPTASIQLTLVLMIGGTLVLQAADVADLWFQSQSWNKRAVTPKLISYTISNGAKCVAIYYKFGIAVLAATYVLDAAIAGVGLWSVYRRFPAPAAWNWSAPLARKLVRESWPFMLSGLAILIYMRIDQLLLQSLLGSREVGIYGAAVSISGFLPILPMTLYTSLAPYVAKKKWEGEKEYLHALERIFLGFGALALLVVLPIAFLSNWIIAILFGGNYAQSGEVLAVHCISNIFIYQGVAQGLWFINENSGRLQLIKTLLGVVLSIVGNLALIPKLGVVGAAYVAVAVQFVSSIGLNALIAPNIFRMQIRGMLPGIGIISRTTKKGPL